MDTKAARGIKADFLGMDIGALRKETGHLQGLCNRDDASDFLKSVYKIADTICLERDQAIERAYTK